MGRRELFVDHAAIHVYGGRGGNGASHFHREKFVPLGGPDGGDGGRGGDVVFIAESGLKTLVDFTYRQEYHAESGHPGTGKRMYGRQGKDCEVRVPQGTLVLTPQGDCLADLSLPGQRVVVARGGRGGRGNVHFATALRRAPTLAELGEPGEEHELILELKMLADVGLVGLPNAGKSTLLAALSAARPKIADYPFTTLTPNLGRVRIDEGASFVLVDIPGLIEGAAQGHGLGHEFLRHVERTRLLIHVVDVGFPGAQPQEAFATINRELAEYHIPLGQRPQVVALNKIDLEPSDSSWRDFAEQLRSQGVEVFPISAATRQGVWDLARRVHRRLQELPAPPLVVPKPPSLSEPGPRFVLEALGPRRWHLGGREVEKWVAMTNFNNHEAVAKLKDIFNRIGVTEAFQQHQVGEGDTIVVGKEEFLFKEDL